MTNTQKAFGVVYTPSRIVDLILEQTMQGYRPGHRVCDPACGDGAFLSRLVEFICRTVPAPMCRQALERITGFDIDHHALAQCRRRLDTVLAACGKRLSVQWDLHCLDSTRRATLLPHAGAFDYVTGNPPYVRIQHLGQHRRERLQRDWLLMQQGSSDLYMAFFEIGWHLLRPGGVLGYITPNTYAKTAAGQPLRKYIRQYVTCLIDFGAAQVFKDAATYSLITVVQKEKRQTHFTLYRSDGHTQTGHGRVPTTYLSNTDIWVLEPVRTLQRVAHIKDRGRPLKDVADIHVGLQTLADHVFIMEKLHEETMFVIAVTHHGETVKLEKALTRPILKASVMQNGQDKKERVILFPYMKEQLLPERQLKKTFPYSYKYLSKQKPTLLGRDKGTLNAQRWYAFGREFGLTTTFGHKLLTSGMNKAPNFQKCPSPHYTFYGGYCIKPKNGVDIDGLLESLNSADMDFYIKHVSRDYQNGWKSYAKSFIQDYGIPVEAAGHDTRQTVWDGGE